MKPSTLRLMAPEVLKFSLQAMASCEHIPQPHWTDLIQLVNQVFGWVQLSVNAGTASGEVTSNERTFLSCRSPSDWPAETMESLGPLILMDDNATSSLPNKVCMLLFLTPFLLYVTKKQYEHFLFLCAFLALDEGCSYLPEATPYPNLRCTEKEDL